MDLLRLSQALFLITLIPNLALANNQPASNSNAGAPQSFAIGEGRGINSIYAASQNHEEMPLTSIVIEAPKTQSNVCFDQKAIAEVLGSTDMSMGICTFLDYHDFAHINQLSRTWRNMMRQCQQADPPLVATNAAQVAAYAHRLIANAPDMNRLSAVKALFSLCNRSYYPERTFLDTLQLYSRAVPHNKQLYRFAPIHSDDSHHRYIVAKNPHLLPKVEEALKNYEEIAQLEHALREQKLKLQKKNEMVADDKKCLVDETLFDLQDKLAEKKKLLAPYLELLQRWQPYGLLLKIAMMGSAHTFVNALEIPEESIQLIDPLAPKPTLDNAFADLQAHLNHKTINLLAAPHISDFEPVIDGEKQSFQASKLCFIEQQLKRLQFLESQLRFANKDYWRKIDVAYLERTISATILHLAHVALNAHDIASVRALLKHIDDATHGAYHFHAIPAEEALLRNVLDRLGIANIETPIIKTTGWRRNDPTTARLCQEIANKTTDEEARQLLTQTANAYWRNRRCYKFVIPSILVALFAATCVTDITVQGAPHIALEAAEVLEGFLFFSYLMTRRD